MTPPRSLQFDTEQQVIDEVSRLRRGFLKGGNWSLAQICWHLNVTTRARLKPGPHEPNTPEQNGRAAILANVLKTGQLPPNLIAPEAVTPPADADASSIDDLVATLQEVKVHPGPFAPHRLFGQLSDENTRKQILIHSAHHLSHLMPNTSARRESLTFKNPDEVMEDVRRLQRGHTAVGHWTLPQAAWHCGLAIDMCLKPVAPDARSTPEQAAMKSSRLDGLLAAGVMPRGLPIAPGTDPFHDAGRPLEDEDVERFVAGLRALAESQEERINLGPFGIVSIDEFRRFIQIHSANHLSNFILTT